MWSLVGKVAAAIIAILFLGASFLVLWFSTRFFKGGSKWSDDSPWHL